MSTFANTLYHRSLFQRAVRKILPVVESALPGWIFKPAYKAAFTAYRVAIRLTYLRFVLLAAAKGDGAKVRQAWSVFRVMPYSLVGWSGLEATYSIIDTVLTKHTPGALVECGVARGGSAALMGMQTKDASDRSLWLFDSYEGLPDPGEQDFRDGATGHHLRPLPKGSCLGTFDAVENLLYRKLKLSREKVHMAKGWFQNSLSVSSDKIGEIAVLRIDADWYDSVRCCLDTLFDQVVSNGFVIIDDYGTCFGARQAVDEFLASRRIAVPFTPDRRGGIYFQKP
jgi:hypothetical protein